MAKERLEALSQEQIAQFFGLNKKTLWAWRTSGKIELIRRYKALVEYMEREMKK